jgi:hypothetical protein
MIHRRGGAPLPATTVTAPPAATARALHVARVRQAAVNTARRRAAMTRAPVAPGVGRAPWAEQVHRAETATAAQRAAMTRGQAQLPAGRARRVGEVRQAGPATGARRRAMNGPVLLLVAPKPDGLVGPPRRRAAARRIARVGLTALVGRALGRARRVSRVARAARRRGQVNTGAARDRTVRVPIAKVGSRRRIPSRFHRTSTSAHWIVVFARNCAR